MPLNQPDIRELKAIVDWVNLSTDVRELSLKYGDVELLVSRNEANGGAAAAPVGTLAPAVAQAPAAVALAAPAAPAAPAALPPAPAPAVPAASVPTERETVITAPMVGTFYASPKPGAAAFVKVGDRVQSDTVLCILEVMKLMNNVEAKVDGVITQILVENEQAVEYGQPLMVIERDA